jgi:cell division septation protein DedD
MKILVFLLVLANALFFAYTQGYFGHPENPDAARVQQQLNADRIHIVGRGEPPAGKAAESGKKDEAVVSKETVATKEEPVLQTCVVWNGLSPKDADRLAALLGDKFAEFKLTKQIAPAEGGSWWVFIPPLPNKADAEKKAGELRKMGVEDYFIVQDAGPNRFAISLGVFSSEAGAGERLADIKAKGVRSAKTGPRKGKDAPHLIEARGVAAREPAMLEAVAAVLPDSRSQSCK